MIILALDVSAISTGVAILQDGYVLHYDWIKPKIKASYGERLCFFSNAIENLIVEYKPNEIIIEDIYKGRNVNVFKILSRFQGVAMKTIYEITAKDAHLLKAVEVRKIIGSGKSKEETFDFIKRKFKLKAFEFETHNDLTDAIALSLALQSTLKPPKVKKLKKIKKKTK